MCLLRSSGPLHGMPPADHRKLELQDPRASWQKDALGCSSCFFHQEWWVAGFPSVLAPSCPSICPHGTRQSSLGSGKAGDQDATWIFQCPASCQHWEQRHQPHLDPPGSGMLRPPRWGWMFHWRFRALLCNAAASIFDGIIKPLLPGERRGLRTGALRDGLGFWQQELWKNPPGYQGLTGVRVVLPVECGVTQVPPDLVLLQVWES